MSDRFRTPRAGTGQARSHTGRRQALRRRIAAGIVGVTALAVLLFALPLALATGRLYRQEELAQLQRDATRTVVLVPDNPVSPTSRVPTPDHPPHVSMGVYRPDGLLLAGSGPARSALAGAGRDGRVHQGGEQGQLAVAVPVPSDQQVVSVVRAAVPESRVRARVMRTWAAMALLWLAVLAVTAVLARRIGRLIAGPLERLTAAARELGDGNFAITAEHSGLWEADAASTALRDAAVRLGQVLERERAFSADASHQLRTPLAGLLLGLESALDRPGADLRRAAQDAVHRGWRLQETIDHLLALRRDTPGRDIVGRSLDLDLAETLRSACRLWQPRYLVQRRAVRLSLPPHLPPVSGSAAAVRQILDVLLDNALRHGLGIVNVTLVDLAGTPAVEVADEGAGLLGDVEAAFARTSTPGGHGIGLSLARSLAEADGARLVVRRAAPHPVFTLILASADPCSDVPAPSGSAQRSSS